MLFMEDTADQQVCFLHFAKGEFSTQASMEDVMGWREEAR